MILLPASMALLLLASMAVLLLAFMAVLSPDFMAVLSQTSIASIGFEMFLTTGFYRIAFISSLVIRLMTLGWVFKGLYFTSAFSALIFYLLSY